MEREVYEVMREVEASHWWFASRRAILAGRLAELGLPASARILEIGSGTGGNLAMLSRFGTVDAIEMDEGAIALTSDGLATLHRGVFPEDNPFPEASFDLVLLLDVLEHVEDDGAVLREAGKLVRPGGKLLLTVPAYRWLWRAHDELRHHKRRYSRREIENLVATAGLRPLRSTHFNTLLFPLVLAELLVRLVTKREFASGDAIPRAPLNSVFKAIFSSEAGLLRFANFSFGLSILNISRKE